MVLRYGDGRRGFKCHHDRCVGLGWKELREKFEPGYRDRWAESNGSTTAAPGTTAPKVTPKPEVPRRDAPLRYQPFPTGALPEPLASHVKSVAASVLVDPVMAALPALCAAAAAIGNSRSIALSPDWTEPSILWGAVVAYTGDGKSPASDKVFRTVRQRDEDSETQNRLLSEEYEQQQAQYQVDRKAWEKGQAKGRDQQPLADRTGGAQAATLHGQ